METITLTVDKEAAKDLASMFEYYVFQMIRDDPEIDNIKWLASRIKLIDAIYKASGEEGIL